MAHEISIVGGRAEAVFAGQKPWHQLGTMVPDHMTVAAAYDLACLHWRVEKRPIYFADQTEIPDRQAIFRQDTGTYFGTCSPKYTPVQNKEQADFIDAVCGEGGAVVECAGALQEGRRVFWTVRTDKTMLKGLEEETLENYLIFSNAHDGGESFRVMFSPIRVVCQNTLNMAINRTKNAFSLYHTPNVKARISAAQDLLKTSREHFKRLGEVGEKMMEVFVSQESQELVLTKIFGDETADDIGNVKAENIMSVKSIIRDNLKRERFSLHHKGKVTSWELYNAITFHTSHQMASGLCRENREKRFLSVTSGTAYDLQQKAFNIIQHVAA